MTPFRTIAALCLCLSALASSVPSDRKPPGGWHPGIPGGIPTSSLTNFITVSLDTNGISDASVAIRTAVTAANTAGASGAGFNIVNLPAGDILINAGIIFPSPSKRVILRGAGAGITRLKGHGANNLIDIHGQFNESQSQSLSSDAAAGSTNVTINDASLYVAGERIFIYKPNSTAQNTYGNTPAYMTDTERQIVRIHSKTGNTLHLYAPLYDNYPVSRRSSVARFPGGRTEYCAVENLTIERTAADGDNNILILNADWCWVKGVESIKADNWHFGFKQVYQSEVRDSILHDGWNGGGNSSYGVALFEACTDNLIENNIFYLLRHSMIIEYGGQGNVFGYNWSYNPVNENQLNTDYLMGDIILHGGIPKYNLFEGNAGAIIRFDNILGGSDYNTAFRNYIQRKGLPATYVACFGYDIQRANLHATLVGNYFSTRPARSTSALARLGSTGDNTGNTDTNVAATIYLDGNYDAQSGTTTWFNPSDQTLEDSLYRTNKPWATTNAWPVYGPNATNLLYVMELFSGGGTNPPTPIPPQPTTNNPGSGTITGKVTLRGGVRLRVTQ